MWIQKTFRVKPGKAFRSTKVFDYFVFYVNILLFGRFKTSKYNKCLWIFALCKHSSRPVDSKPLNLKVLILCETRIESFLPIFELPLHKERCILCVSFFIKFTRASTWSNNVLKKTRIIFHNSKYLLPSIVIEVQQ